MSPVKYAPLRNPPLIEANLEVNFTEFPDFTGCLESFRNQVVTAFPEDFPIEVHELAMTAPVQHTNIEVGRCFWNIGRTRALQLRQNGLSLSILDKYVSWDVMLKEYQQYFAMLGKFRDGVRTSRCTARYINKIQMPETSSISSILNMNWNLPASVLNGEIENFSQSCSFKSLHGYENRIGVTILPKGIGLRQLLFVDISASDTTKHIPGNLEMWNAIQTLRDEKNRLFFGLVNDVTQRGFQ